MKGLAWLSQFKYFKFKFGKFYYWIITNKKELKIDDVDRIGKAKLVCKGTPPNVKCHWEWDKPKIKPLKR